MNQLVNIVRNTIKKYNMIQQNENVIVGLSGGPDSVCLIHILNILINEYNINLYAVHLNHMIRGEDAFKDANYVKILCENMNIHLFIKEANIIEIAKQKGISEEVAGRYERYAYFNEIARKVNAKKIAIAQNMNDQVETILMRFIRGTGLEGLGGIKPLRKDGIIRPLINVKRKQIENYCKQNNLNPRIDKTNLKPIYTRNKMRINLIPYILEQYNPNFLNNIVNMGNQLREDEQFLEKYVKGMLKNNLTYSNNCVYVDINFILKQHSSIKNRIIREMIKKLKGDIKNIEYKHIEKIIKVLDQKPQELGIDLPDNMRIEKQYNKVCLFFRNKNKVKKFIYTIKIDQNIYIKEIHKKINSLVIDRKQLFNISLNKFKQAFDYDKINEDIYVRNRIDGDKFIPYGMNGTKKLKDYFIDLKIPKRQRDKIPILATKDDILWIIGYRISNKYKYNEKTKKILIVEFNGGNANDE